MTPLTVNPNITVLVDKDNNVLKIATNVAPDVKVTVTRGEAWFNDLAKGKTFVVENPTPVTYENC